MKVKELIALLQTHDLDAEVSIAESQENWDEVLVIWDNPGNDAQTEINLS